MPLLPRTAGQAKLGIGLGVIVVTMGAAQVWGFVAYREVQFLLFAVLMVTLGVLALITSAVKLRRGDGNAGDIRDATRS